MINNQTNGFFTFYQDIWRVYFESKKGCKDQESIQSSTTPDPGYRLIRQFFWVKTSQIYTEFSRYIEWSIY